MSHQILLQFCRLLCCLFCCSLLGAGGCGGGECRYDADCKEGRLCKGGKCVKSLDRQACTMNSDCQSNEACIDEVCQPVECRDGETKPCYDGAGSTRGVGLCRSGNRRCVKGKWSLWCEGQIVPTAEVCDQQDNDCNNKVDDDPSCTATCKDGQTRPCYTGPAGTDGVGICRRGSESCAGGKWAGCSGDTTPAPQETCDDKLDNNCNGQVDEGCGQCKEGDQRPCYTGPATTRNVGLCKKGQQVCSSGQWGPCNGEVKPVAETCGDNKDNDCNGKIDDLPTCQQSCTAGQTRPCYTGAAGTKGVGLCQEGKQTCSSGQWGPCTGEVKPVAEACNDNKDNNCNGQVDENCGVCKAGESEVCYTGASGCSKQPDGSYRCHPPCQNGTRSCQNGQWGACTGEVKPVAEACNDNKDNNCDGQTDENCGVCQAGARQDCYTGASGCVKQAGSYQCQGLCQNGTRSCSSGQWGTCTGEVKPVAEVCNDNKDNDCDGQTDENCSSKLHGPCTTNNDCDPGQICIALDASRSACFQDCTNSNPCPQNTDGRTSCVVAAVSPQGKKLSICVKEVGAGSPCDPSKSLFCRQGTACDQGTCRTVNVASRGQLCNYQANPPTICQTGDLCVSFGSGTPAVCLQMCSSTNPSCSGANFQCVTLSGSTGQGACIQTCQQHSDCTYANHVCNQHSSGAYYCVPQGQSGGSVPYGGACNQQTPSTTCQQGYYCLRANSTATQGFCTMACTGSCPASPPGAKCIAISASSRACIFDCSSGNCPTGLRCQSFTGGLKYCFP